MDQIRIPHPYTCQKLQQQKTKFPLIILVGRKVSLEMFLFYLFFIS